MEYFQVPMLSVMWLDRNNFTNISSLRRIKTPRLQQLEINDNFVIELSNLHELNAGILRSVWIKNVEKHIQVVTSLFKMESKVLMQRKIYKMKDEKIIKYDKKPYNALR